MVSLPQLGSAFSMDGKSSDHIDAESIIPDAIPIVILFKVSEGFEKKKTRSAPSEVNTNGRVNDKIRVVVKFIFFRAISCYSVYGEKIFLLMTALTVV